MRKSGQLADVGRAVVLAAVYVTTARIGLSLGAVSGVATSVWPPTGISLAALLLFGYRLWPGIACGALLVNLWAGLPVFAAAGIAAGNTLEALCGVYLLQRVVGFRSSLERLEDVLGLVVLAAVLSSAESATVGVTSAWLAGVIPSINFGTAWWAWWVGDALGDLVLAPVLLVWSRRPRLRSASRTVEAAVLVVVLGTLCVTVFTRGSNIHLPYYPEPYAVFPLLVWAALRFGQPGTTIATLMASTIAIWGTAQGWGPFAHETVNSSLMLLQTFMGVAATTALVLGAVITERKAAARELQRLAAQVAQQARTLDGILSASPDHVYTLDRAGRYTYASLAGARAMGRERSDIVGQTSAGLGLPTSVSGRATAQRESVFATGRPLVSEVQLPTTSGLRDFEYTMSPILLADGSVEAVVVSARDITERTRAAEALQESEARYRQLIELSPDTIAVHRDGRIVFVNTAGVKLLGAPSAAALVGKPILDFVHPDYHALAIERVHQMVDEHKPVERIEEKFVRFDGTVVDVEVVAMALTYQNQPAVQVVIHDITQRKEAEEARRRTEAHFRSLIENSLDLIAVVDSGGIFRYASPSNRRVLGYAPEELVGKNAFAFFHPDDAARIEAVFVNALQHPGDTPLVEFRFRHKNGSWRFIEAIGNNVLDELGGTTVVINSRDITDRKLAEQALEQEAHVSQTLADMGRELISSPDRPMVLDRLCQVTVEVLCADYSTTSLFDPQRQAYFVAAGAGYGEEAWESLRIQTTPATVFGDLLAQLERDEVVQLRVADFPNPVLRSHALQLGVSHGLFVALRRGSEIIGIHTVYRREPADFSVQQVRIARGVAQLASLALEHARVLTELEGANRVKSDFVATMSHELRTPLNVIMGYTALVLDGAFGTLTFELAEIVERVDVNARALRDLIEATLDISRLETGRVPLDITGVHLADLIAEVESETRELQRRPGIQFVWDVGKDLPFTYMDAMKLKVVLKNLIGNAVKFTEHGTITVGAYTVNGGVEISVADTGIGISPEALPVIFDAFRQADSSSTRGHGGVGLGLYIVRRLLDLLEGTIAVESAVGYGSTFRVWLPTREARGGEGLRGDRSN